MIPTRPEAKSHWRRFFRLLDLPTKKSLHKSLTYWKHRFMHNLAYPHEERNIALDFDATASTNIDFWKNFVRMAHVNKYNVSIVTARHSNNIGEIQVHFEGLVRGII